MKWLRNKDRQIFGIEYFPFMILGRKGVYEYCLVNRIPIIKKYISHTKIHKGKKNSFLNKYTMTFLWVIYSILAPISLILLIISYPISIYIEGAKNFITDSSWIAGVRFFGWVNLAIILLLTLLLIFTN